MAGFPKKERQRIIDEYLAASGNNMFVPHEFVEWLVNNPITKHTNGSSDQATKKPQNNGAYKWLGKWHPDCGS